jgi:hypothetical protein
VRAAWSVILVSSSLAACSPLRMTAPETGAGGEAGDAAGAAGRGGAAATGGTGGNGVAGTTGTGGATAGTGGGAEPAGLIAHWRFNEGTGAAVADSSGNGQPMALSSTGATWATSGHEGNSALTFDGAAGFAEMVPATGQALYNYPVIKLTFSAWVKPHATAASREHAAAVARAHEDYAFEDFWIGLVNGKPGCIIHNADWQGAVSSSFAPAGAWTHIACTYAMNGQVILYVNGTSAASASSDQTIGPIPPRILVGADEVDPGGGIVLQDFFPGTIDDVRIYKETLTPSEVAFIAR